jgi:beta-glucanase (GH16 family)
MDNSMKKINFCNYEWITQERWGQFHKDKPYVWYDEDSVITNQDGSVSLLSEHKPKYFKEIGRTAQMAVGLLSCTEQFGYGVFELECKLPDLAYSWPAFWMWSWSDWPPEIDIFEGYSNAKREYDTSFFDKLFKNIFYNVKTNIHIKNEDKKWDIGDKSHFFGYKDPRKSFNKYSVVWRPDYIHFYYNDTLVRKVDEPEILKLINGHKMNVIINNSLHRYHKSHITNIGTMDIKNFKYKQL